MNILHLIGFLGADPEERYTNNGVKVWNLRLATRSYKNGQEETIWWRITVWGDQQDKFLSHCKKGKPIYVIAEMNKLDIYTDKNGQAQVSYDATARSLHFLPTSDNRQEGAEQQQYGGGASRGSAGGYQQQPRMGEAPSAAPYEGGGEFGGPSQHQEPAFAAGRAPSGAGFEGEDEPLPF